MGRVVIFGIGANNQSEVCDKSRLSLSLDNKTSETSLISSGDLGLFGLLCVYVCMCVFGLTRTSGLNGGSL